jgi:tRNA(His) 5'-end guanylyltransferase
MIFDSLADKCLYYRKGGEHSLMPNGHIIMMLDGRSFSKVIKKRFKLPFDPIFVGLMNLTAQYLCENIPGVQFAYVQSDEISLYIKDEPTSGSFFGLRQTKLLSIAASLATGRFNQLFLSQNIMKSTEGDVEKDWKKEFDDLSNRILTMKPFQFDCKVWNVPTANDVFAWFLYRQLDCIRNSKQQTAQTWLSHNKLIGVDSDKQVEMLKNEKGVDWNDFEPEVKFGRLIKKVEKEVKIPEQFVKDGVDTTMRMFWEPFPMPILSEMDGKNELMKMIPQ